MNRRDSITVSAPGKIHLMGEHAVVYGKPALLAAINKRCFVEVTKRDDKQIVLIVNTIPDFVTISEEEILTKNKTISQLYDYVMLILQQTLRFYKKSFLSGFSLVITNQIPEGRGFGSSAAIAVAVAGAITMFFKEDFDKEKINKIALLSEQFVHDTPSGGDNSASVFGGFVWFRKETDDLKLIQQLQLTLSEEMEQHFLLLDTGRPSETTGEMVGLARKFVDKNSQKVNKIFAAQEALTKELLIALQRNSDAALEIIKKGEKNLETLGVVSPSVKKIIRDIEKKGGAAKICGAGGKKKGSGMLLVYHPEQQQLKKILESKKIPFYAIMLGSEGVRIES
jgi:mevalonate kinase